MSEATWTSPGMLYGIIATQSPAVVNRQIWQLGKARYTFSCRLGALMLTSHRWWAWVYPTGFLLVAKSMFVKRKLSFNATPDVGLVEFTT